ncbi:MAG: oligosaccharide flippase family protein [Rhodothermaceae bacterium]
MSQTTQNDISGYLKTFFKKNLAYTLSFVFERSVVFLLLPFYTSIFSPDDYGVYSIFIASVSIGAFLYGMGIENSLIKFKAEDNPHSKLDSTVFTGMMIPSLFFTLLVALFSNQFSNIIFGTDKYQSLIILTSLSLFFDTVTRYFLFTVIGEQKSKVFLVVSAVRGTLTIGLNILLVWYLEQGLMGAVWSYLITIIAISLYLLIKQKVLIRFSFDKELYRKLFKYSVPVMLTSACVMTLNSADTYILKYFFSTAEVGKYSASYKFGTGMNLFVTAYATAVIPFALNLLKKEKEHTKTLSIIFESFFCLMIVIFLFIGLFYREIVNFNLGNIYIIDPAFHDAVEIIPVIVLSYIFMGIYTNYTIPFHFKGNTHKLALITFGATLINVLLNLILVPVYSYWGAAIVTLLSFAVLALVTVWFAQKTLSVKYNFLKMILILFTAIGLYLFAQNYFPDSVTIKSLVFIAGTVFLFLSFRKVKSSF